jgi:hypothetical protein
MNLRTTLDDPGTTKGGARRPAGSRCHEES